MSTGRSQGTARDEMEFAVAGDLAPAREFVRQRAGAAGLEAERVELLALAVSELMSNTLQHTGGAGLVRVWAESGAVLCEVEDLKPRRVRSAGGAVMPSADAVRGRGLAIVERVCDAVSLTGDGAVVRLRMAL